jgi:hypothetical protein
VRLATPSRGRDTIFGLWGVGPQDAWFVGGGTGRDGFVWRLAGGAFTELPLPASVPRRADGELPSVLKVWGSSAREVWFAGDRGLLMRSRGSVLEHIPLQTSERLFTVHGSGSGEQAEVIAVGGNSQAVVAESQRGFQPEPLPQLPLLQGVFVDGQGALAVGQFGVIVQRTAAGWQAIEADLPFPAESLHAIYRDPSGRIWTVGGNVLSARLDGGIVMVRSPRSGAALPPWPGRRASAAAFPSHP